MAVFKPLESLKLISRKISVIFPLFRCFLHPSASLLKETVFKVLKSAMVLHKYCTQYVQDPKAGVFIMETSALKSLEENYAKRHQFLATTLKSMTEKRHVPHLDGLAAALLHSCPAVVV